MLKSTIMIFRQCKTWPSAYCFTAEELRLLSNSKDSTRKILDQAMIKNIKSIKKYLIRFDNSNKIQNLFVDNAEWLTKLNYIKFLREVGSHFTINKC